MDEAALYRLLTWLSPAYPTGGFSYSHGLEYAVEAGLVTDAASLESWIATILCHGAGRVDGVLLAHTHAAASADDREGLVEVAEFALAMRATAEMALESQAQGDAFLTTTRAAWPGPEIERVAQHLPPPVVLPVAVGAACGASGVPLRPALAAYLHGFAANLVSAGVRLIPLGQTAGQRAVAALEPVVAEAVERAAALPLDDIGAAVPMVDWTSMRHETQYTRLFRS